MQIALGVDYQELDWQMCAYIEFLWLQGQSKEIAAFLISGVQHFLLTKRKFPGANVLLRVWRLDERPNRAPVLPSCLLLAMVGACFHSLLYDVGIVLLLGFAGFLRTGEATA